MKKNILIFCAAVFTAIGCSKSENGGSAGSASSVKIDVAALDAELLAKGYAVKAEMPEGIKWETNDSDPVFSSPDAKTGGTMNLYHESFPMTFRTVGPDSNGVFRSEVLDNQLDLLHMHPETGNILPGLATHWASDKSMKKLYIRLDPRARWSDGVPVTSLDFAFSLMFMRSPHIVAPWYNTYYEEKFETVEIFDDHTFAIVGKEKKTLKDMAYYFAFEPRPRHFHKLDEKWVQDYNWKVEPNTGAYQIDEVEKGKFVTFKRKKDWWAKDLRYFKNRYNVDKIKISVIRDDNIAWEHFKKGKIDGFFRLTRPELWYNKSDIPEFKNGYIHKLWFYHDRPQPTLALYMNQAMDLFKSKDVRIAFAYAMNVDKVIKTLLRSDASRLHTNTYGHGAFYNEKVKARPFDLAKANMHLDKAGWNKRGDDGIRVKNGKRLSVRVTYGWPHQTDRIVLLKEEAKKAGIELTLQLLDGAASWKTIQEKKHEMAFTGFAAQDKMQYWGQYHSDNANKPQTNNFTNTADPVLDKWIEAYRKEFDEKVKISLAHKIQQRLHDEADYIPLWTEPYIRNGYWRWVKFPEPPMTKQAKDPFAYPFHGDWGGTYWIDTDVQKETKAAMKAGKAFEPVTILDTRYKKS